ncbi:uncharacterized protein LOC130614644 [Hydractinia symbiolongicarpus]|uniref:uncharacterized protein LOC130614644 n=1 Tax=Hydractinia symbiolongicarpus TaxID=13093 RepID=UPI00254A0D36|nr:uncharacterized protein LOC130614644 [Hydractinia symbiolongicarpus]
MRLQSESNVGVAGRWIYRVAKPLVVEDTVTTPPTGTPIACPAPATNACDGKQGNIVYPSRPDLFISCVTGSQPICQPCPIGLNFVESCNQCLQPGVTECVATLPPVTNTIPTVPFDGCTTERGRRHTTFYYFGYQNSILENV